MDRPRSLLRVGFPFVASLEAYATGAYLALPTDVAIGEEGRLYILAMIPELKRHAIRVASWDDGALGAIDICEEWSYDESSGSTWGSGFMP